ncbi:uncharacterized protein LOC100371469 [Saccoglossus kowalevskii]
MMPEAEKRSAPDTGEEPNAKKVCVEETGGGGNALSDIPETSNETVMKPDEGKSQDVPSLADTTSGTQSVQIGQNNAGDTIIIITHSNALTGQTTTLQGESIASTGGLGSDVGSSDKDGSAANEKNNGMDGKNKMGSPGRMNTRSTTKNSPGQDREPDEQEMYMCTECVYGTPHKYNLKTHMKRHQKIEENELHKCDQCDYNSPYKHDLRTHMQKHDPEKPYKCSKCDFSSIYKHSMLHHVASKHEGLRPHRCDFCNYASARKQDLRTHLAIHSGEKPFRCSECDYATQYKASLKAHMDKHKGLRPYQCDAEGCDFATNTKQNLRSHKLRHSVVKPYQCSHCDYSAAHRQQLINHEAKHRDDQPPKEKTFKCDLCEYATAHKHSLTRHLLTHEENRAPPDKVYACDQCTYTTGYKNSLKRHMATHSPLKPFKCGHCDYSAINMTQMHVHIAKHTGVKPYKCEKCDYATANKQHLTAHQAKHSDLKMKCDYCDFTTSWKQRLRTHIKAHQMGRVYKCTQCKYVTSSKADLKVHCKEHLPFPMPVGVASNLQTVHVGDFQNVASVETTETQDALSQISDAIAAYQAQAELQNQVITHTVETSEHEKVNEVSGGEQVIVIPQLENTSAGDGEVREVVIEYATDGSQVHLVDEDGNQLQAVKYIDGQVELIEQPHEHIVEAQEEGVETHLVEIPVMGHESEVGQNEVTAVAMQG